MKTELRIRKDFLKFSCAHMTVFPDGSKERMHGHHYQVSLTVGVKGAKLKDMVSFQAIKNAAREICESWDEHLLIAKDCPHFRKFSAGRGQYAFELCKKAYSLPTEDVVELSVENITTEALAEAFFKALESQLKRARLLSKLASLSVLVEESPGQGAEVASQW